jgi:hypothetical protein
MQINCIRKLHTVLIISLLYDICMLGTEIVYLSTFLDKIQTLLNFNYFV